MKLEELWSCFLLQRLCREVLCILTCSAIHVFLQCYVHHWETTRHFDLCLSDWPAVLIGALWLWWAHFQERFTETGCCFKQSKRSISFQVSHTLPFIDEQWLSCHIDQREQNRFFMFTWAFAPHRICFTAWFSWSNTGWILTSGIVMFYILFISNVEKIKLYFP